MPGGPDISSIFPRFNPPESNLSTGRHAVGKTLAAAEIEAADWDNGGIWDLCEAENNTWESESGILMSVQLINLATSANIHERRYFRPFARFSGEIEDRSSTVS